jgi:hypothetical protein
MKDAAGYVSRLIPKICDCHAGTLACDTSIICASLGGSDLVDVLPDADYPGDVVRYYVDAILGTIGQLIIDPIQEAN